MNKIISKGVYFACWAAIAFVSFIYVSSSMSPWKANNYNVIEPLVYLDTKYYALRQEMYGFQRPNFKPDEVLVERKHNFYSGVSTEFHATTHFRPDFEQFPTETILILVFRLLTFAGIVLFLFLLSQVLRSVTQDDPFDERNFSRLFYMGIIGIFVPIIRTLHSVVLAGFVTYDPKLLGYEVGPSFMSLWLMSIGILVLVLSFFFKETSRIYEEQKLTV